MGLQLAASAAQDQHICSLRVETSLSKIFALWKNQSGSIVSLAYLSTAVQSFVSILIVELRLFTANHGSAYVYLRSRYEPWPKWNQILAMM
jgi:hypothetical protein